MFEDAKVNFTQEGVLLKRLRKQFGGKAFSTQKKVRMLCDGHTKVTVGSTKYAYEEGEKEETIEFSYKSLREELEKQIAAEIQKLGLPLSAIKIERVDLILGGDHGAGAFQFGVKVVIVINRRQQDEPTFSIPTPKSVSTSEDTIVFDIAIAEVICRKDNAEVLKLTIEKHLKLYYLQTAAAETIVLFCRRRWMDKQSIVSP
jgi:hypothetical protein